MVCNILEKMLEFNMQINEPVLLLFYLDLSSVCWSNSINYPLNSSESIYFKVGSVLKWSFWLNLNINKIHINIVLLCWHIKNHLLWFNCIQHCWVIVLHILPNFSTIITCSYLSVPHSIFSKFRRIEYNM